MRADSPTLVALCTSRSYGWRRARRGAGALSAAAWAAARARGRATRPTRACRSRARASARAQRARRAPPAPPCARGARRGRGERRRRTRGARWRRARCRSGRGRGTLADRGSRPSSAQHRFLRESTRRRSSPRRACTRSRERDRAVEAQALLDGVRERARGGRAASQLRGVARQRRHAVADQADRGLEARDQQADRLREQLVRREPIARLLGADQLGEQVVAERLAPLGDQLVEVGGQRAARRPDALDHLGRRELAASRCVASAVHSVKRSRSATGTPIISQITVDGHRQREVGDHVASRRARARARAARRRAPARAAPAARRRAA